MTRFGWVAALVSLQFACSRPPQYYVERGNALSAEGKFAEAEIQYRKSLARAPAFAEGSYRLALLEHDTGREGRALEDLQRAADLEPANERYGVTLADMELEAYQKVALTKFYDQANREAVVLLGKDPNSFDGLRLRGDLFVIDRKYDDAMGEFRKADAIRPNDARVALAMTQILFAGKRDEEGEALAKNFLAIRKEFIPMYDVLEAHYIQAHRTADAEHLLEAEIAALPKNAHPRLHLANLYKTEGRDREMSQLLGEIASDRADFPAGAALAGDFYADSGRWEDALAQYRAGVQQARDFDKVLYEKRIERMYEAMGKREEALAEANEVLKANPKDTDVLMARAVLLRESPNASDRQMATDQLKALAAEYPQNEVVLYHLGLSYLAQGDAAAAWKEFEKSAQLRKDYAAPRLRLAEIADGAGDYAAALAAANEVLALEADNLRAKLLRAAALVGDKSFDEAERELSELSRTQPHSTDVTLQLAALARAEKNYPKAETLYQSTYQPGSADTRALEGLVQVCVLEQRPDKAQGLLEAEVKRAPESQPARLLLAGVASEEGNYELASTQYRWLESRDPKSAQPYSALGELYVRQGKTAAALASYEKASELAPNDTKVLGAVAILESNSGHADRSIATLKRELALDPGNDAAMNNLAFNLAETGQDLDRALTLAQTVARKFPNEPGVVDTLGWVYARRGMNQSAIQVLRTLVEKNPQEPAYRYHLAMALAQANQKEDARREFTAAMSAHPDANLSGKIQENLARIK